MAKYLGIVIDPSQYDSKGNEYMELLLCGYPYHPFRAYTNWISFDSQPGMYIVCDLVSDERAQSKRRKIRNVRKFDMEDEKVIEELLEEAYGKDASDMKMVFQACHEDISSKFLYDVLDQKKRKDKHFTRANWTEIVKRGIDNGKDTVALAAVILLGRNYVTLGKKFRKTYLRKHLQEFREDPELYEKLLKKYYGKHAAAARKIFHTYQEMLNNNLLANILEDRRQKNISSAEGIWKKLVWEFSRTDVDTKEFAAFILGNDTDVVAWEPEFREEYLQMHMGQFMEQPELCASFWEEFVNRIPSEVLKNRKGYLEMICRMSVEKGKRESMKTVLRRCVENAAQPDWYRIVKAHEDCMEVWEMKRFVPVMGADILLTYPEWKAYASMEQIDRKRVFDTAKRAADNREQIKAIMKARGICQFVHFTDVENLPNIIRRGGLLTRAELERIGDSFEITDEERLDGKKDSISLSVSYPNYLMFYNKRKSQPGRKWCVLILKAANIVDKSIIINTTNAASFRREAEEIEGAEAVPLFASLFDEQVGSYDRNNMLSYSEKSREKYPTDPQSEILCREKISLEDISYCCFGDAASAQNYGDLLRNAGVKVQEVNEEVSRRWFAWGETEGMPYYGYRRTDGEREETDG